MNSRGLSLVEVLIAAIILVLAASGVLYVFSIERGSVSHTGRQAQAMQAAQEHLEQLKEDVRGDTWNTGNLQTRSWTTWQALGGNLGTKFSGRKRYRVGRGPGNSDYRVVEVQVDWQEP